MTIATDIEIEKKNTKATGTARQTSFRQRTPACATESQYSDWFNASISYPVSKKVGFCEDCLPDYQKKMKLLRRCENPEIRFFRERGQYRRNETTGDLILEGGDIYGAFVAVSRKNPATGEAEPDEEVFAK